MSHPSREEWMAFLYEDLPPTEKAQLGDQLNECDACRSRFDRWRQTMGALDKWPLPAVKRRPTLLPWTQWAAAAAVLLMLGILIGQNLGPKTSDLTARLDRAEAEAANSKALVTKLTKTIAEDRDHDQAAVVAALQRFETQRAADLRTMRKDLETVATLTEAGFRNAENQIVRLAGYSSTGSE